MRENAAGRSSFETPMGPRAPGIATASIDSSALGVPVLYATYVSGSSRVCQYNQAEYNVDTTVSAETSCPRTLE